MSYQPLHHKYRPQIFADLVGQEAIATTLTHALQQQRIAPAYLFTGARGTGKTSSARILSKSLNCLKSGVPTENPCGVCEVCRAIVNGSALDIIEIDAASNTGVDNIRELIERSQFAPVQCRYKVYVIDECLTGDSLVRTDRGIIRIDDPSIAGAKVLSYNESLEQWEFKKVTRWLDQGKRQTFIVETNHCKIKCTGNHLIRTATGWIAAKDVKEGMKILSPVNVDAAASFTGLEQMGVLVDLPGGTSLREIHTDKEPTTLKPFWKKLNHSVRSACVDVVSSLRFLPSCGKKATESKVFCPTGRNILSNQNTASGKQELRLLSPHLASYHPTFWDSYTELYSVTAPSPIRTNTADFQDCLGLTESASESGWSTKQNAYQNYDQELDLLPTKATEKNQLVAAQPVILNLSRSSILLGQKVHGNEYLRTGSVTSHLRGLLGGIWMMGLSALALKAVRKFNFIPKVIPLRRINSLLTGLQNWAIQPRQSLTQDLLAVKFITTSQWEQIPLESGWLTSSNTQSPQWTTSLETVKSVRLDGIEQVYDIEVEDNHNFVANGLLVHNCHMLSTAAFNALLKTLEEPPSQVVFVLATTDPQRVLPTIISRCQRFDFRRIPLDAMVKHLRTIADQEKISIADDALTLVGQISQGGLRDAESLLDQLSLLAGEVTVEKVWDLVGSVPERDLMSLLEAIAQNNPETLLDCTHRLMDRGREPLIVLQNLASFYRDLLIAKTAPARGDLVAMTASTWTQLCEFAKNLDTAIILAGQQHLRSCEAQIKNTTQPRLWLEVTLLGLLPAAILQNSGAREIDQQPAIAHDRQLVRAGSSPVRNQPATSPPQPKQPTSSAATPSPVTSATPQATSPADSPEQTPVEPDPPESQLADEIDSDAEETLSSQPLSKPPAIAAVGLGNIWQEALKQVQPFSTQTLLRQQACLLRLTEQEAHIGIIAQWLKTAKTKIENLEAAFEQSLKRSVKVSLEIATPVEIKAAREMLASPGSTPNPTFNSPDVGMGRENQSPLDGSPSDSPAKPQRHTEAENYRKQHQPQRQPDQPSIQPPPQSLNDSPTASWEEDEASRAAKQLAEFFGGKVVDLSDDGAVTEATEIAPIEPEALLEKPIAASWKDVDDETDDESDSDDDDLPF